MDWVGVARAPVAVGSVQVHWAIDLNKHLQCVHKQLVGQLNLPCKELLVQEMGLTRGHYLH